METNPTSDEILRKAVLACLGADDRVALANLRVGVANGVVHLAGAVSSLETRMMVAELAGAVQGVRGVVNRIEAPGAPSPGRIIHLDFSTIEERDHASKRSYQ